MDIGAASILGRPKDWARDLSFAVAVGFFLALVGPFGTYDTPLERRLLAFVAIGCLLSPLFFPAFRLLFFWGLRHGVSVWLAAPAAIALATLPGTLVGRHIGPLLLAGSAEPVPFGVLYGQLLAVNVPVVLAVVALRRYFAAGGTTPGTPTAALDVAGPPMPEARSAAPQPRLLDRLPPPRRGEILALEAEDHYVRVHTTKGSSLLLMRLADAIAELEGIEGLQVHRSWWVAKGAVTRATQNGRRMSLELRNGIAAPVTRENVQRIRRAGWV